MKKKPNITFLRSICWDYFSVWWHSRSWLELFISLASMCNYTACFMHAVSLKEINSRNISEWCFHLARNADRLLFSKYYLSFGSEPSSADIHLIKMFSVPWLVVFKCTHPSSCPITFCLNDSLYPLKLMEKNKGKKNVSFNWLCLSGSKWGYWE